MENVRLMLQSPPTEDNAGAAYQQVAENRAANTIADEFRMLLEGGDTAAPAPAAGGGKPAQSSNPDFDALMQGGETAPAPQASQGEVSGPEAKTPAGEAAPAEGDDLASQVSTWARRAG